jgi:hypothetical protein
MQTATVALRWDRSLSTRSPDAQPIGLKAAPYCPLRVPLAQSTIVGRITSAW